MSVGTETDPTDLKHVLIEPLAEQVPQPRLQNQSAESSKSHSATRWKDTQCIAATVRLLLPLARLRTHVDALVSRLCRAVRSVPNGTSAGGRTGVVWHNAKRNLRGVPGVARTHPKNHACPHAPTHTHTHTHAHAHTHTRARARARTRTHTPANAHGRTPRLPGVAESGINARRRSWAESAFHTERVKHSRRQRVSTPMRMGLAGTLWAWPRAGRCCAISVALPLSTMSATMADSYYEVLRQIGRGGPLGCKPCVSAHCKGVPRAVSLVFRLTVRECLGRPSQGTTGRSLRHYLPLCVGTAEARLVQVGVPVGGTDSKVPGC
jgi:hypothetical protein